MTIQMSTANPFQPVHFDAQERRVYQNMVHLLVEHHLGEYESFRTCPDMLNDTQIWKCTGKTSSFAVFTQVDPATASVICRESVHEQSPTLMPQFVAIGTITGKVEDALFGLMTPTSSALQMRDQLFPDHIVDGAHLSTIVTPQVSTPLTCTSLNWSLASWPKPWSALLKQRDFVYLDATGFRTTSTGEAIGFHLKHSVEVPRCHELFEQRIVRAKVSTCTLFHQVTSNLVHVFVRTEIDPMGKKHARLLKSMTRIVTDALMAYSQATTCGRIRTLSCLVECRARVMRQCEQKPEVPAERCRFCKRRATPLHRIRECGFCTKLVCSRCSMRLLMGAFSCRHHRIRVREQTICVLCIETIQKVDATTMAEVECRYVAVAQEGHELRSKKWSTAASAGSSPSKSRHGIASTQQPRNH